MEIEDLIKKSDFHSLIFQHYLIKSGQISSEIIFKSNIFKGDITYNRDKVFLVLIKPLFDICDCFIRINDLSNININFIFVLKPEILPKIKEVISKNESAKLDCSDLSPELLEKYKKEINESNIKRCINYFLKTNSSLSPEDFLKEVDNKLKTIFPFQDLKISLDLYNIIRILFSNWKEYMLKILTYSKSKIKNDAKVVNEKMLLFNSIISNNRLYWDNSKNTFPLYPDVIASLYKEVFSRSEEQISKADIEKYFLDSKKIIMFKIKENSINPPEVNEVFEGMKYKIYKEIDGDINILENNRPVKIFSSQKTNFFKKKIKNLIIPQIDILIDNSFKKDIYNDKISVLFSENINDIINQSLKSKNYKNIKVANEIIKLNEFKEQQVLFEITISSMINFIELSEVNKHILTFINKHKKKEGFFQKLINSFISIWKEKNLEKVIQNQEEQISTILSNIEKINKNIEESKYSKSETDYNPVQIAINIIKSDLKKLEIREILSKKNSDDFKINEVMNLYEDIGATSRAVINKNEKSKQDFMQKLKKLL